MRITGDATINGNKITLHSSTTLVDAFTPIKGHTEIDCGGGSLSLRVRNFTGKLKVMNSVGGMIFVDLISGRVELDETVDRAQVVVRGLGACENSTTNSVVDTEGLVSLESLYDERSPDN